MKTSDECNLPRPFIYPSFSFFFFSRGATYSRISGRGKNRFLSREGVGRKTEGESSRVPIILLERGGVSFDRDEPVPRGHGSLARPITSRLCEFARSGCSPRRPVSYTNETKHFVAKRVISIWTGHPERERERWNSHPEFSIDDQLYDLLIGIIPDVNASRGEVSSRAVPRRNRKFYLPNRRNWLRISNKV